MKYFLILSLIVFWFSACKKENEPPVTNNNEPETIVSNSSGRIAGRKFLSDSVKWNEPPVFGVNFYGDSTIVFMELSEDSIMQSVGIYYNYQSYSKTDFFYRTYTKTEDSLHLKFIGDFTNGIDTIRVPDMTCVVYL